MRRYLRFNREVAARVIADIAIVNVSLLIALTFRYFWLTDFENLGPSNQTLQTFLTFYIPSFTLLTCISLVVFTLSGFYTYGRFYHEKYKAIVITQAVFLTYLIYAFVVYLYKEIELVPRSSLLGALLLTWFFLLLARLWTVLLQMGKKGEIASESPLSSTPRIKKILVIGGAGYIGSALLPKLLNKGYHVRVLDLMLYGDQPINGLYRHPHLEVMQGDFRQVDKVVDAVRGTDTVIHLGAIVGDPACALDEDLTIEVNVMATRMIAEVAKASGVGRFVFASTCSVYGASDEVLDENSALNPVSLYARSKIASERVLMSMADHVFSPVCLRFGTIYGLSGRSRFDLVVNQLTASAAVDGVITVFGGDQWRPFLHVDDAAAALLKVCEAPVDLVRNEVFNVGSNDQNFTLQQVGEIVQRIVPGSKLIVSETNEDKRNYRVDFSKIRNVLDFQLQWNVERGAAQILEAFRSGRLSDHRDPKYHNVRFLMEDGHLRIQPINGWAKELIQTISNQQPRGKTPAVTTPDTRNGVRNNGHKVARNHAHALMRKLVGEALYRRPHLSKLSR
ncbi:MAG TPA: NAD-dependent dehydratase [Deltaproteobacteria bacterium]|nr:NAD-dependent dehydratase [Deltaproteobacteria bacterium]